MRTGAEKRAPKRQGYLLDTSVVSALAPGRSAHWPQGFGAWLEARTDRLYLPSVALAELGQGIGKLRRAGGTERADRLEQWLDGLIAGYGERILALDAATARLAGQMSDAAIAQGRHPGFPDVAIAAMAKHAGLMLLTSNIKHFQPLGVDCLDPLVQLPAA